ncbi:MAG: deoxyguanosinetriphosphate triphosphohydrolase [Clostridiales bacterium]|nr:deoxyguanosinetriphosphate triphosphohydrolase [Clostridiales bacterium]
MKTCRQQQEEFEEITLAPQAMRSACSAGRKRYEEPCTVRTCYQRDIDRIVHSKAFRRLKHKTQVFLQPEGDHYRTRMTHTIEVMRIARTLARSLRLNEDLAEAIAWGHDLGHTPFGHAGERALDEICPMGFTHNRQSLRVVDTLEKNGKGLNLCMEVRDGILNHTGPSDPHTLEGKIVRLSDRIAYISHDMDDAVRAGILKPSDIPKEIVEATGNNYSGRLNAAIVDVIETSRDSGDVNMSPDMFMIMERFRNFLFERVYRNPVAKGEEIKIKGILEKLYDHYMTNQNLLPADYLSLLEQNNADRIVCDYIAGMTDKYAIYVYDDLFIPEAWQVR